MTNYSLVATAVYFALGGLVTAVFSGSLARLASNAGLTEVLTMGMVVPSFTWVVQLTASGLGMDVAARRWYWGDLGRICLLGAIALLPAAAVNLVATRPPLWFSAANVLASVAVMAWALFRLSASHAVSRSWPASWCLVICINMTLFYLASRHWWNG